MSSSNTTIHVGFWTNYSRGEILGSTLTLKNRNAGILIAAIAIFIQLIGGQSWGIIRFITHQIRATAQARDGLYHQQQAILRNDNYDVSTIWAFARIAYAWRHRSRKSFRNSVTLILIGALHLTAFGTASILASHVTTADGEVLIAPSPYCGFWKDYNSTLAEEGIFRYTYYQAATLSSHEYVQNCLAESQSLPECNLFKQLRLNWTATTSNPCPFGDLCLGPSNGTLYLDTGMIDSRRDLGINSRNEDRIQWRKNVSCVPITTKGYSKNGTSTVRYTDVHYHGQNTFNYTALFYGSRWMNLSTVGINDPDLTNSTYIHTNFVDIKIDPFKYTLSQYEVETVRADAGETGEFYPIPALSVPDTSLTLAFATFFLVYTQPSDDAWLSAHQEVNVNFRASSNSDTNRLVLYSQDQEVSVLGCLEQQQICNPNPPENGTSTCTRFRPVHYNFTNAELRNVLNNDRQLIIARTLLDLDPAFSFSSIIDQSTLLAQSLVGRAVSAPLAPNQWILEAENWFTIGLVSLQRLMLEVITGPSSSQYLEFIPQNQAENNTNLRWMCESQIIRRSDYTNFHTLSIMLIFALGFVVYVINQSLDTVVGWIRIRWSKSGRWRQRVWWSEGVLQLQRRAFESIGIGEWEVDECDRVPVTVEGKKFSALKNWDEVLPLASRRNSVGLSEKQQSAVSQWSKMGDVVVQVDSKLTLNETKERGADGRPRSI